jgi:hypothetical protein
MGYLIDSFSHVYTKSFFFFLYIHQTNVRASLAMIFILAIQNTTFSILATNFLLQILVIHSLLFLNIIF